MAKIWALYTNELLKISKKLSVYILLGIMLVLMLGAGALISSTSYRETRYNDNKDSILEQQQAELQTVTEQITAIEEAGTPTAENAYVYTRRDILTAALQAQINLYNTNYNDYRITLFSQAEQLLSQGYTEKFSGQNGQASLDKAAEYIQMAVTDNFAAYIAFAKSQYTTDQYPQEYINIHNEILDLQLQLNITGKNTGDDLRFTILQQLETARYSLLTNTDTHPGASPAPLTPEARAALEQNALIYEYQLRHNIASSSNSLRQSVLLVCLTIGEFMAVLMLIILAGGAISTEITSGSIKSLIIAPVKRWKIFTAKVLSLVTVLLGLLVSVYIFSSLSALLFGEGSLPPYVAILGGKAVELPHALFYLVYLLARFVPILFYMSLAFLLSTLTRNTALSVGLSIALFFVSVTFISLLASFSQLRQDWVTFVPFVHMQYYDQLFPANVFSMLQNGTSALSAQFTPLFSLGVLAAYIALMLYTAFDSFTRRDIK